MFKKRRLAAPLLITVAACGSASGSGTTDEGSCKPPDCHMNPPPQRLEPIPSATQAPPPQIPRPIGPPRNPPPLSMLPRPVASSLPQPTGSGEVQTRPDGTCWEIYVDHCKPPMRCNPPPPMQVACPAKP